MRFHKNCMQVAHPGMHVTPCMYVSPALPGRLAAAGGHGNSYTQHAHAEACMQVPLPEEEAAKQAAKPERLAIGGEGGFQTEASKFTLSKAHTLVVLPEMLSVPLSCPDLPELVLGAIQGVMVRGFACWLVS